jgi:hypothetical protein
VKVGNITTPTQQIENEKYEGTHHLLVPAVSEEVGPEAEEGVHLGRHPSSDLLPLAKALLSEPVVFLLHETVLLK